MSKGQDKLQIIKKDMRNMQELLDKKWIYKLKDLIFYFKKVYK
jgi:hypothetical protein